MNLPLDFHTAEGARIPHVAIEDVDGTRIADAYQEDEAADIVQACNAYNDLVSALQLVSMIAEHDGPFTAGALANIKDVVAGALAKAGAE